MLGPEYADIRLDIADELLRVGASSDRPSDTVMGLLWRAADLFLSGESHAERAYADLLGHEPANRHAAAAFTTQAMRVMLTIRAGRLTEAEALAETCARAGAAAGDTDWMGWYTAQVLTVRWFQGRVGELVDTISNIVNSPTLSVVDHSFVAAQAVACAAAGQTGRPGGRWPVSPAATWPIRLVELVARGDDGDDRGRRTPGRLHRGRQRVSAASALRPPSRDGEHRGVLLRIGAASARGCVLGDR